MCCTSFCNFSMSCSSVLHCGFLRSIFRHESASLPSESCNLATTLFNTSPCRRTRYISSNFIINSVKGGIDYMHHGQNVEDDDDESVSLKHFVELAKDLVRSDTSTDALSPYWFTPLDCGAPLDKSPLLLFLPGVDGTELGLIKHHKKLGKIFEMFCLHIPHNDRTPFTDLVKLVERTIRSEHQRSSNRPIYLVGESFGACLALSVAASDTDIDLVLILANPATSFNRSQYQRVFNLLQLMPAASTSLMNLLRVLSSTTGVKMANLDKEFERVSPDRVAPLINYLSDPLLPSQEEGLRLKKLLENCEIHTFKDYGRFLLMEDAFDLVSVIKQACI